MTVLLDERETIGDVGEVAVQEFFNSERSKWKYDPQKDGMIGKLKYQVKTIRLNHKEQGFWIGQNKTKTMWGNIDKVDMLIFVRVPETEDELATIYLCINHRDCFRMTARNDGIPIRCYPLTNCVELGKVSPDRSYKIYQNSKQIRTFEKR